MENWTMRDRIKAIFLLSAVGDALGMPVDDLTQKEIKKRFKNRISSFLPARADHRCCNDFIAGQWTDDTQLTLAIARSLTRRKKIDLPDIYREHIVEMKRTTVGWGSSTLKSLESILGQEDKIVISQAGNPTGAGNGVAARVAPIGAFLGVRILQINAKSDEEYDDRTWLILDEIREQVKALSCMTHRTRMAVASGYAQVSAICRCLLEGGGVVPDIDGMRERFINGVINAARDGEATDIDDGMTDKLSDVMMRLLVGPYQRMDVKKILDLTRGATSYVYNSLPFSYAIFLREPNSIDALYEVVNAGGDTSTNGAIVGALLGAYNGTAIIPSHLLKDLWNRDEVEETASQFCDSLGL